MIGPEARRCAYCSAPFFHSEPDNIVAIPYELRSREGVKRVVDLVCRRCWISSGEQNEEGEYPPQRATA